MLNDYREAHDAGSDALRETDEDVSDFENIAEEGEGMHDFLEPGDLVALSSYAAPHCQRLSQTY